MTKKIMILGFVLLVIWGCAVRRPLFSPHRSNTPDHRQATRAEDCLKCHGAQNMPHETDRGNCLKCHRLEMSG